MEHEEARLWALARGGDAQAFAAIFDVHRDRVFRQAVRLLDSWPDAEDVSASAFLELFRRRDDVRVVNGSVLPWLLVTTANLAGARLASLVHARVGETVAGQVPARGAPGVSPLPARSTR